ncbi:MAG: hypothetical protein U1E78_09700 [Gammaproteobacteria bacterium]
MKLIAENELRHIAGGAETWPFGEQSLIDTIVILGSFGVGALVGALSTVLIYSVSKQGSVGIV